MSVVTVSQKGWVVIPAEVRNKYDWHTGDRIKVVDYGGVVSLVPVLPNPEEEGMGARERKSGGVTSKLCLEFLEKINWRYRLVHD